MTKMILKKVYISRGGGGGKANLEKVYILNFFFFDGFPYIALKYKLLKRGSTGRDSLYSQDVEKNLAPL